MQEGTWEEREVEELGDEWLNNPLEGFFVDEKEVRTLYTYLLIRRNQGISVTPVTLIRRDLGFDYHQVNEGYNILQSVLQMGRDLDGNNAEPVFRWTVELTMSKRAILFLRHPSSTEEDGAPGQ